MSDFLARPDAVNTDTRVFYFSICPSSVSGNTVYPWGNTKNKNKMKLYLVPDAELSYAAGCSTTDVTKLNKGVCLTKLGTLTRTHNKDPIK